MLHSLSENLFVFHDTCEVYILRIGSGSILIDFGSGDILGHLTSIGIDTVHAVLMTHHHRDNAQGLRRAVAAGIPIYVPHSEAHLFADVETHWQRRNIDNNYNVRQDRFSIIESVAIQGTLEDYGSYTFAGQEFEVIPTPGHTTGSITLMTHLDGLDQAFSGDLIAAPGKVWSLAATQWTYNGLQGVAMSVLSLLNLAERELKVLLPSHGEPMVEPKEAIHLLVNQLMELIHLREPFLAAIGLREPYFQLREVARQAYAVITPHILHHWMAVANTFVLRSESGKALMFDFGYDMFVGFADGTDRASRRPLLYSLPALKRDFNIRRIDAVVATHYHDDHVAGFNLMRRVEGAEVWAAETFADILEQPKRYDLPCLWYEPISVDRRLPLETAIQWEEYTLTLHALPGHTRYAVAIALEVDNKRVLITGDQYQDTVNPDPNYVYANRFAPDDFVQSAKLYRMLEPDLILTGHWEPIWTDSAYFDRLDAVSGETARLHHELLLDGSTNDDVYAAILPYQSRVTPGSRLELDIEITNPFDRPVQAEIDLVLPAGLHAESGNINQPIQLDASATTTIPVILIVADGFVTQRARMAVDLIFDGRRYGQQAAGLIFIA